MLNAIVIGAGQDTPSTSADESHFKPAGSSQSGLGRVPVLGCSSIVRAVEYLKRNGITNVSLFGYRARRNLGSLEISSIQPEMEAWSEAAKQLVSYGSEGSDAVLIVQVGAYSECDVSRLLQQHREQGEAVTRAFDKNGLLSLWVVNPNRIEIGDGLPVVLDRARAECEVNGYVNRLEGLEDLRRLAADILMSRCRMRPQGSEVRPGLWIDEEAQIGRSARLVAPVFIGRKARIADDCLITRSSAVEHHSHVDFGTVVEDSSILPNTYVGIGLDLAHSVVDGSEITNLHHGVRLNISDPVVLRRNGAREQQIESIVRSEATRMTL